MRRIRHYKTGFVAIPIWVLVVALGCNSKPTPPVPVTAATTPENTFTQKGSVRELTIWPDNVEVPDHEGKAEFVSYCGICHSLKYITMQPAFQRATWEAEVHKMVDKYGAPIDSATSQKIVGYLMAINGVAGK